MLATPNRQEANKRNLHTRQRPQRIPRSIANIEPRAIPPHANQHERMQRQQIRNEHITTPSRNHVSVKQRRHRTPEHRSHLNRLDPEVKGKHQQEDRNGLVVVAPRHRPRNVTRRDSHKRSSEQTRRGRGNHLRGQKIRRQRRESRKARREEHADVSNVDGEGQEPEKVVDDAARHHESGVEGAARNSS
jgi:hypothetical protein